MYVFVRFIIVTRGNFTHVVYEVNAGQYKVNHRKPSITLHAVFFSETIPPSQSSMRLVKTGECTPTSPNSPIFREMVNV